MVKKLIVRFIYEYGSKALNSVLKAYKETVKSKPNTSAENKQKEEKQNDKNSAFGKFSFNNLIASPMTKDEALKILNLKESEATPEVIMQKFDKYFESNDPEKGGSFYIQNKIYYAKEYLMEKHPKEMNKSNFNPDSSAKAQPNVNKEEEKPEPDSTEKYKNDKI